MLGIIIGVMSVTVLVSIVQSTTNNVSDTLSQLGGNVISATVTSRRSNKITTSDIKSLENNPAIESVSPIISGSSTAKASGNSSSVTLKGITEEYEDIQNISVQKGRYILDVDNDNRLQVCLIGVTAAKDLFGHTDVEGETIRISGRNFKIIGVLEEDGSSQRDSNDSVIYTPFTTAQRIMQNSTISSFYVSATNEGMLNMAESAVDSFLLEKTGDEDSYTITNQSDIADSVSDVTNSMTYMIGGIAGISLLVGGNHEHHACVRYRTNKRDRNPKSHRGEEERYPGSIYDRVNRSVLYGRCDRNRIKCSNHFWNESVNVSRLYDISRN